jgi:alpha-beta hydrolase superfamily lysophospholipase
MRTFTFPVVATTAITLLASALVVAIAFGGPGEPAPMLSINDPFKRVDFSDLPAASQVQARDGTRLAFRAYAPSGATAKGSVVLVHGSSARGSSMHVLAKAFAAAGYAAYALDMRGHGDSGTKGQIAYVGQLDDDLEDFMRAAQPARPATLAGFSSGGGFALRVAAGERQALFDNYLLLSPFISQDAPTYRPNSGGWARIGMPRIVALSLLDALGVHAFDTLPVVRFALNDQDKSFLTPEYSYALALNFRPRADYRASIRAAGQPLQVLAGRDDEAFRTERFADLFKAEGKHVPVTLLPGIGHMALTLDPVAAQAAVTAVTHLNAVPLLSAAR